MDKRQIALEKKSKVYQAIKRKMIDNNIKNIRDMELEGDFLKIMDIPSTNSANTIMKVVEPLYKKYVEGGQDGTIH